MKKYKSSDCPKISAEIVCPMYKGEENKKLKCEGFEANIYVHVYFSGKMQKSQYEKAYCESFKGYCNCPIYKMAAQRYEED